MGRIRKQFLRHWFAGVFVIIVGLWLVTTVAYALGADGFSVGNRYTGQRARIDFQREHDQPVLALGHNAGLAVYPGEPGVAPARGAVVKLRPGLPLVFCWLCGELQTDGGLADVEYRQGTWLYRGPIDVPAALAKLATVHGSPRWEASRRQVILTVAYDLTTGARRQVAAAATLDDQAQVLAELGLPVAEAARLSPTTLADLRGASMQREGCVIVHAAFVAAVLLWFVVGGLALALTTLVRRLRRRA